MMTSMRSSATSFESASAEREQGAGQESWEEGAGEGEEAWEEDEGEESWL